MDSFEQVVATILDRKGYWVRTSVKVVLTPDEKKEIGRPSSPRWELDIVAYGGARNELLVVECKSYLDSYGVRLTSFEGPKAEEETRYKLFSDDVLRRVVLSRLEKQLIEQGFCPPGTRAQLALAAGKIYGDPAPLRAFFQRKGWQLFENDWLVEGLRQLDTESYENSVASVVTKILLRNEIDRPRKRKSADKVTDERDPIDSDVVRVPSSGYSVQIGFTNEKRQAVVRATGLPGTDYGQSIYVLRCGDCGEEYGANGSDVSRRKCPRCQGGKPGLPFIS